ncbi:MAG: tRNA (guanine(10)-N(2))-dimethyltransferase [Candidatus Bathyarchaeia archaeon]
MVGGCSSLGVGFPLVEAEEGGVSFLIPKIEFMGGSGVLKSPVFYNPRMGLNRDVAVIFLKVFQELVGRPLRVCEPLTGCGVRGLRFASEVKGIREIVINDLNPNAAQLAKLNVERLGFDGLVKVEDKDANLLLSLHAQPGCRFDYIDLDPFGSPAPFLDSAFRALRDGGVVALTATDMAPLCGTHQKACVRRYGAKPLRTEYCHELAVRLLVGFAIRVAASKDQVAEPLFCHYTDHYVRVYLRLKRGARDADSYLEAMGFILHCFRCLNRTPARGLFPKFLGLSCEECGGEFEYAGPLWLGGLWNKNLCQRIEEAIGGTRLSHARRVESIVKRIIGEIGAPPTYYIPSRLCDLLNLQTPPISRIVEALRQEGFEAALTHFNPQGIKTAASQRLISKVLKRLNLKGP